MDERLERHLCNLHNEVFEAAESRINTECSLIICEGISDGSRIYKNAIYVPSLYVRVYRHLFRVQLLRTGSLIICEGISDNVIRAFNDGWVPSLYVRVYR